MVDVERFREAMALFPASVLAVTVADGSGRPRGLIATAVCSYTATPPTVLVSIGHDSRSFEAIRHAARMGVHLLGGHQKSVALTLAGKGDDKFSRFDWSWRDDVPVVVGSLLTMSGGIVQHFAYLDHTLFFVELEQLEIEREREPLVYFRRQMRPIGLPASQSAA